IGQRPPFDFAEHWFSSAKHGEQNARMLVNYNFSRRIWLKRHGNRSPFCNALRAAPLPSALIADRGLTRVTLTNANSVGSPSPHKSSLRGWGGGESDHGQVVENDRLRGPAAEIPPACAPPLARAHRPKPNA